MALGGRSRDVGGEQAFHRFAATGCRHDLAHVGPEEARGRRQRAEKHELFPHLLLDAGRELPFDLRFGESVSESLRARAYLLVALTEDDPRERIHVRNRAVALERHVDLRNTAHHLRLSEARIDALEVRDAIEMRHEVTLAVHDRVYC